ncbi:MAG: FeoA domain-containing protein [Candidatus Eremiobacterota bacterium]
MIEPGVALGVFFLVCLLIGSALWPTWGIWWRWREAAGRAEKILVEDALKHLFHDEYESRPATLDSLAGELEIPRDRATRLLLVCERLGLVTLEGDRPALTDTGRVQALHVIRVHRLWECFLAERTGLSSLDWHAEAERREHTLTPSETEALDARLNHPSHDPHGDPIPTARGELPPRMGVPLTELPCGTRAVIGHVEDEPQAVYSQLVAQRLRPGVQVRLLDHAGGRVRFWADGVEVELPSLVAASLTVTPLPPSEEAESRADVPVRTLVELPIGGVGRVSRLDSACRGLERERLLDLGVVPGTRIEAVLRGPLGDPVVYRVRGASIALRREQAERVLLEA